MMVTAPIKGAYDGSADGALGAAKGFGFGLGVGTSPHTFIPFIPILSNPFPLLQVCWEACPWR